MKWLHLYILLAFYTVHLPLTLSCLSSLSNLYDFTHAMTEYQLALAGSAEAITGQGLFSEHMNLGYRRTTAFKKTSRDEVTGVDYLTLDEA